MDGAPLAKLRLPDGHLSVTYAHLHRVTHADGPRGAEVTARQVIPLASIHRSCLTENRRKPSVLAALAAAFAALTFVGVGLAFQGNALVPLVFAGVVLFLFSLLLASQAQGERNTRLEIDHAAGQLSLTSHGASVFERFVEILIMQQEAIYLDRPSPDTAQPSLGVGSRTEPG